MTDTAVIEETTTSSKVQMPSMYKVILHNDDETTFDFVILVLTHIFHKSATEAVEITQSIHHAGLGIAGAPYTKEIAEEKVQETITLARANNFPLTPTFEPL